MKREMLEREPVVSAAIQKHVKVNFVEYYTVLFSLVVTRFSGCREFRQGNDSMLCSLIMYFSLCMGFTIPLNCVSSLFRCA